MLHWLYVSFAVRFWGVVMAAALFGCAAVPDGPGSSGGDAGSSTIAINISSPTPMQRVFVEDGLMPLRGTITAPPGSTMQLVVGGMPVGSPQPVAPMFDLQVDVNAAYPAGVTMPMPISIEVQVTDPARKQAARAISITAETRYRWASAVGLAKTTGMTDEVRGIAALPTGVVVSTMKGFIDVFAVAGGPPRCSEWVDAEAISTEPVASTDGARAYVGTPTALRAVSTETCKEIWHVDGQIWKGRPAYDGAVNRVYASTFNGELHAIDGTTGAIIWKVNIPMLLGDMTSPEVIAATAVGPDGSVYQPIEVNMAGHLVSVDRTGAFRWGIRATPFQSSTLVTAREVVIGGSGNVYSLNPANGDLLWSVSIDGGGTVMRTGDMRGTSVRCAPAIAADGSVVFCDSGGVVRSHGMNEWMYRTPGIGHGGVGVDTRGFLYVGDVTSTVHSLGPGGVVRWRAALPNDRCQIVNQSDTCDVAIASPPVIAGNNVFFGTIETGAIYAFTTE